MHTNDPRLANLAGAWSLAVADAMREATEGATGYGGTVPAALVTLEAYPGRSAEDLRAALGLSQPGVVRLVDRLAAEGWLERRREGRALALVLTAAGRRVARRLLAERGGALDRLLEPLGAGEREQLEGLLGKLLEARSSGRGELERLCRLCRRETCSSCPVARGAGEAD